MPLLRNIDRSGFSPIILSGCSSGGKSTLLEELSTRGYQTIQEAGRRVVQGEIQQGGNGLPWINIERFCEIAMQLNIEDYEKAFNVGKITFLDRSILDLFFHLSASGLDLPDGMKQAMDTQAFHKTVFFTPPWNEIFHDDGERQKSFDEAVSEYEILRDGYQRLGYNIEVLDKTSVQKRADFIEAYLSGF